MRRPSLSPNCESLQLKQENFRSLLENKFNLHGKEEESLDEMTSRITDTIQKSAVEVSPPKARNSNNPKLRALTKQLMKKRREMKNEVCNFRNNVESIELDETIKRKQVQYKLKQIVEC